MGRLSDLRDVIYAADVIVFKSIRFRVSRLIRYIWRFHFQKCTQIDMFSVNTLSVLELLREDGRLD